MMTPQEVSEHAFAKATFGGYNMAMVDEFLDALTVDYTTLYKENAALKSKMKVLVDKVEEYRSTEDAMRKALLTAQRMADNMVAEAENQKAELLRGVEAELQSRRARIQEEIAAERLAGMVGTVRRALVETAQEGFLEARLPENIVIRIEGDPSLIGRDVEVEITGARSWIVFGRLVRVLDAGGQ